MLSKVIDFLRTIALITGFLRILLGLSLQVLLEGGMIYVPDAKNHP